MAFLNHVRQVTPVCRVAVVFQILSACGIGESEWVLFPVHDHRLGATIGDITYAEAEQGFFDDLVRGAIARRDEIDALISDRLAKGWSLERLDKPMKALLRVGAYELLARADVPVASVISEYVDVAHAFYDKRETGFVNGLLSAVAREVGAEEEAPA